MVVSGELVFEPSFDRFKKSLCDILEAICDAVRKFERLETQLYLDWAGPQEFLKVPSIFQTPGEPNKHGEPAHFTFIYFNI